MGDGENLGEYIVSNLPKRETNRVKRRKRWIGKDFRPDAQVDGYEIKVVMLDLGSDVNILPNKSWESLGNPKLVYSPIHLWMSN